MAAESMEAGGVSEQAVTGAMASASDAVETLAQKLHAASPSAPMLYWENLWPMAQENYRAMAKAAIEHAALAPPPAVPESVREALEFYAYGREINYENSLQARAALAALDSIPDPVTPSGRADTPPGGGGAVEDGKVRVIAELLRRHDGTTRIRSRHYGTARTILNALAAAPTAPEPAASPWPANCLKPSSCARNRICMYARSRERCPYHGQDLTEAVARAEALATQDAGEDHA